MLAIRINLRTAVALTAGASTLGGAWLWPLPIMARDLFFAHMLQHLLVMNMSAVLIAVALPLWNRNSPGLALATILQLAALWIWHMPAIFAVAHHHAVLYSLMQISLLVAALLFWRAVLVGTHSIWRRIFALLVTAKIFCLLGAAFVFSRRTLYPAFGNPEQWGLSPLDDQQLAGLLMVSSCALIYIAAAIALFARWLFTTGLNAALATR